MGMTSRIVKSLLVVAFSCFALLFSPKLLANETPTEGENKTVEHKTEEKIDPAKIILEHVADAHDFHFFTINGEHYSIPLPVVLYSKETGLSVFMSSAFHHGHETHNGFRLLTEEFAKEKGLDTQKDAKGQPVYELSKIYAVGEDGMPKLETAIYDFSLTKNVVQILLTMILLVFLMLKVAKSYAKGVGVTSAPTGFQNAVEPVITFVRDEVAKPNLGHKYKAFMPFLLTTFFFILINNIVGLIPGTANVTGNIAFTAMLGLVSFIVILLNTNKHFWSHIFNPPVPMGVKPIMIPVEFLGIFTKPFALIIRLFANMISGHIIILSFICLIFIFSAMNTALGWGTSPFFVLLSVFIYLIEVMVAFLQAFIFTNLTAVFIGQAFEGEHHSEEAHH